LHKGLCEEIDPHKGALPPQEELIGGDIRPDLANKWHEAS
jgi:hypothetical protein